VAATNPTEERERAQRGLDDSVAEVAAAFPEVPIASEVIEGNPARVLTTAGDGANLLVLGSHGHSRLFHAVLGSVAEECVRAATCPVVVIPVRHATGLPASAELQVTP
jgi:nucleotide-binding universal stress UspA family protein